jgi:hypothetical protein
MSFEIPSQDNQTPGSITTFESLRRSVNPSFAISKGGIKNRTLSNADNEIKNDQVISNDLFDNKAELKMRISEIAMHLTDLVKSSFFEQIDELLDEESFEVEDNLIDKNSFDCFLRVFSLLSKPKIPAFTVSSRGNIVANWVNSNTRVHWEFLRNRFSFLNIIYCSEGNDNQYISFRGNIKDTLNFLKQQKAFENIKRG